MKGDFQPLSPADHVMLVMDREIRSAGLPGAWCGFGLELEGTPDPNCLHNGLAALSEAFPVLSARLVQRGRRFGWQRSGDPIPFTQHTLSSDAGDDDFLHQTLLDLINASADAFSPQTRPLTIHLLKGRDISMVLAIWLHPLFDAGGAKRVFDFLMAGPEQRQAFLKDDTSLIQKKLRAWPWWHKLRLFWRGKGHNEWLDQLDSSLATEPAETDSRSLGQATLELTEDQTRTVEKRILQQAGSAGRSLFLIACLMRTLETLEPSQRNDAWCIPYAFNLRPSNAPVPVTGNQVSVLFAQAPHSLVQDRRALLDHLKRQYADTVRRELDMAYLPLMWLGQWLSLEHFGRILRWQKSGGERSSAWFSDIGEIRFREPDFLGAPITKLHHASFITSPPSLAVLFSRFNGRLSASVNYLLPDIEPPWIEGFCQTLKGELLTG